MHPSVSGSAAAEAFVSHFCSFLVLPPTAPPIVNASEGDCDFSTGSCNLVIGSGATAWKVVRLNKINETLAQYLPKIDGSGSPTG